MNMKLALCQMQVGTQKEKNLERAEAMIREAKAAGAHMVSLSEFFNSPYSTELFREYAEPEGGPTFTRLSGLAAELDIYIVGGTIPELDGDRLCNTSFIFNRKGELIAKHRKVHLFDIYLKDGISMKESDQLTAGNSITVFDTEYGKVGVAICYDVRFPEMMRMMALAGAKLIILPACFPVVTGKAHWDLTMRCRAIDNQVYFAANSAARPKNPEYFQAFGHSCIIDPWGEYRARADEGETIIFGDLDMEYLESVREQLPLLAHRRPELYVL